MGKNSNTTDAEAMMAILTYSIENVANGNIDDGLSLAASALYRSETNLYAPFSTKEYRYRELAPAFGTTGFDSMYQDKDMNQVEHFINEAKFAATFGSSLIDEGAFLFEAQHGLPFDQSAQADFDLGLLAGQYVEGLRAATTREERALVTDQTLLILNTGQTPALIPMISPGWGISVGPYFINLDG